MESHVKVLGVLYIIFSSLLLLGALLFLLVAGGAGLASSDSGEEAVAMAAVGGFFAVFFVVLSLPGLIGGIYLMKFRPWARILVIVLGCLNLPSIPLGTALGIYTLWALFHQDTKPLFGVT